MKSNERQFVDRVKNILTNRKINNPEVSYIAKELGITDKTRQKEFYELGIVETAKNIIANTHTDLPYHRHTGIVVDKLIDVYNNQVNLNHRTSRSIMFQQYSTPVPLAYIAGRYAMAGFHDKKFNAFEPSAGNGLLTVAIPYSCIHVNEVDSNRLQNLKEQPFKKITNIDATTDLEAEFGRVNDVIITNPPFGSYKQTFSRDGMKFNFLDPVMAVRALETMKDKGRAAIIVGGVTEYDEKSRIKNQKDFIFLSHLYKHYNVEDVINIDGHKLYSRQGTAFDVRLILINGRKEKPGGWPPLGNEINHKKVDDFILLTVRVNRHVKKLFEKDTNNQLQIAEAEAQALLLMMELEEEELNY